MDSLMKIPVFTSETEEAQWWDTHPDAITNLFLDAKNSGQLKRLASVRRATKSVTIRLAVDDVDMAQQLANKRGIPYQTLIKMLLHQALERERLAG